MPSPPPAPASAVTPHASKLRRSSRQSAGKSYEQEYVPGGSANELSRIAIRSVPRGSAARLPPNAISRGRRRKLGDNEEEEEL